MRGTIGEVDVASAKLNEEENVQDLEKQGLNREKSQAMSCCL